MLASGGRGCRRGDSTCVVRWCSPLSFLCWKQLCSVRCMFCICADVRRRCCMGCCTAFACTAVFEKRMEASIRRSFPEGASGLLCRSLTFVLVRVVLAEQFDDFHRWLLSIVDFAVIADSVGEFIWPLYAAGLLCFKASAAKQETWVGRSDCSTSQETIRLTLIAVAVITCWKCVFGNPK